MRNETDGTRSLLDLGPSLYQAFSPDRVDLLPKDAGPPYGNPQGQWQCKAFFFASVWDYIDRLRQIAPFEWSLTEHQRLQVGKRFIVVLKLTICGIAMFGVGAETVSDTSKATVDPNDERSAWSKAARRAAAYFGLGLPFYFLSTPKVRCTRPTDRDKAIKILDEPKSVVSQVYAKHESLLASMPNEPTLAPSSTIAGALAEPFPVGIIKWLAHAPDGDTCTAFPYLSVWDYIRRINSICYGQWWMEDARVEIASNKVTVKVRVAVVGNVQECLGEKLLEKSNRKGDVREIETAVENAWAEAMKGVFNYHSLGLYLRFVDAQQVAWNAQYRRVENPRAEAIKLYHRYNIPLVGVSSQEVTRIVGSSASKSSHEQTPLQKGQVDNDAIGEKDIAALRLLCQALGRPEVEYEQLSSSQARALKVQLTAEVKKRQEDSQSEQQRLDVGVEEQNSSTDQRQEDPKITMLQVQWLRNSYIKNDQKRLAKILTIYRVEKLEDLKNSHFRDLHQRIEEAARQGGARRTTKSSPVAAGSSQ